MKHGRACHGAEISRAVVGKGVAIALVMGVISMAGRGRDKLCRIKLRTSPHHERTDKEIARVERVAEGSPNDALLRFVRALARAAAIADYNLQHRPPDASSDNESGDLRKV